MDGLDVAGLSVESVDVVSSEALENGHGMTEIAASCGVVFPCSCLVVDDD
ncbi:hypothetical protein GCM10027570_08840 [Streptomonospora sediminis]